METFLKDPDLMGKLLPALATGLLAFIPAILSWMSNQATARGRSGRVNQLAAELKLLEQWLAVSRSVRPAGSAEPPETVDVHSELDGILAEYRAMRAQAAVHRQSPDQLSPWSRRLMIFVPLSIAGWLWSIAFWYIVLILGFAVSSTFADATQSIGDRVGTAVVELALIGIPLFFIRRAALRLRDAQIEARQNATPVPA